jgi:hypothetical protein
MVVQQNFIIAYLRGKNVCLQHSLKGTAGRKKSKRTRRFRKEGGKMEEFDKS